MSETHEGWLITYGRAPRNWRTLALAPRVPPKSCSDASRSATPLRPPLSRCQRTPKNLTDPPERSVRGWRVALLHHEDCVRRPREHAADEGSHAAGSSKKRTTGRRSRDVSTDQALGRASPVATPSPANDAHAWTKSTRWCAKQVSITQFVVVKSSTSPRTMFDSADRILMVPSMSG